MAGSFEVCPQNGHNERGGKYMAQAQPDRLDRIEATLDVFGNRLDALGQRLGDLGQRLDQTAAVAAENTNRFTELAESMLILSQAQIRTNQNVDLVIARIDEMQSEVRGLQTENRCILDRLFPE
jgi:CII-binding regulator of phage lambda lysogenization HflD